MSYTLYVRRLYTMGVIDTAGAECLETCTLGTVEGKSLKDIPIPTNGILLYIGSAEKVLEWGQAEGKKQEIIFIYSPHLPISPPPTS
jgi:hypothetical protein